MKGLLYKDWTLLWRHGKMYLLILLAFSLVPQFSRMGFAMAYAAILPYSVIAYDEQSKWNRLAIMLPYTDKQLVLSKYILSWIGMLLVMLLSAVSRTADYLFKGQAALLSNEYAEVFIFTAASSLFSAIVLPLIFRFGVERGRLMFIPVIVGGVTAVMVGGEFFTPRSLGLSLWAGLAIALAIAVAVNIASVTLSCKFFRRGLRG